MHRWKFAIISSLLLLGTITITVDADLMRAFEIHDKVWDQCKGKFKNKKLTQENIKVLIQVINKNELNLCMADLRNVDLKNISLERTDLSGADLSSADLSDANLTWANLSGANLDNSNLSRAGLRRANLSGTYLRGAKLSEANLSGADLSHADLSGAELFDTDLSGSMMINTNMVDVKFQPEKLPGIESIASADNLSRLTFSWSPEALVKLRNKFKEAGYQENEREITYAINHSKILKFDKSITKRVNYIFQYVFFELTTQWGMDPGRALQILLILIPIFAIPYVIVLHLPSQDGIWLKWTNDRIRLDIGTNEPTLINVDCWYRGVTIGLYFSLLSAFNIGWRELNVGNWIQRLQPKEYTFQATGWVRTVSGVQSLISVYLLAIWALTYFGRPFE